MFLIFLAGLLTAVPAKAEGSVISGFNLSTCAAVVCIRVESPQALVGQFGVLTLDEVRVSLHSNGQVRILEGHDAVLNLHAQTLAIRKVSKGPAKDVLIYLESGAVSLF